MTYLSNITKEQPLNSGQIAAMSREDTQFKEGNPGNGGRPKGSRNKLSEAFLKALADNFEEHGTDVIDKLRETLPAQYCNVIAKLMPKLMELSGPEGAPLDMRWTTEIVQTYMCSECKKTSEAKK